MFTTNGPDAMCPELLRNSRSVVALLFAVQCVVLLACNTRDSVIDDPKITFGRRQLNQVLDDRPDMQGVISEDDELLDWIVSAFDGERTGFRIYWNADSPVESFGASHTPPYEGYPATVCITGGSEETPVDKWAGLVFELHNLENSEDFAEIHLKACSGELDEDTYVREHVKLEFKAIEKTAEFFKEHPLPESSHGKDIWYNWVRSDIGTFDEYYASLNDSDVRSEYIDYYRSNYREQIVPYLEAIGKGTKEKTPQSVPGSAYEYLSDFFSRFR